MGESARDDRSHSATPGQTTEAGQRQAADGLSGEEDSESASVQKSAKNQTGDKGRRSNRTSSMTSSVHVTSSTQTEVVHGVW
jgi:hypothetical protein